MKHKTIAFLSFWPLFYSVVYLASILLIVGTEGHLAPVIKTTIKVIDALTVPTFWLTFGMIVFYLVLIFKRKIVREENRLNWAAAIFFLGVFSLPLFWFRYLRNNENAI